MAAVVVTAIAVLAFVEVLRLRREYPERRKRIFGGADRGAAR